MRSGWTLAAVAGALGVHYRSVQRWAAWYRAGGLAAVRARRMGGRGQEPFLSPAAEAAVAAEVETGRFGTAAEIRAWVETEYGATSTLGGVYSLLKRLRCAPKVPRPLHAKADLKRQDAWERGVERALAAAGVTAGAPFGFADEMRVGLRGTVRRVWGRRGVKVRQRLQLRYEWRSLFLVVDSRAGKLYWCWNGSMAAEEVVGAVGGLQKIGVVSALVWDNAPSHRDAVVQGLGPPLIGLPPYSPELNPAERVFEELRRATEGKVYASLDEKVAAVERRLQELEADPERVRSLAHWDWIRAAVDRLPALHAA